MVEETLKRYADDITLQELVRLRVENERLREALRKIADYEIVEYPTIETLSDFARATLKGDE